jgi:hypothetical protein
MYAKIAATLALFCLLSLTLPLRAQDTLLGQHKINLRLKPLPAAEVLNALSVRSKAVAGARQQQADQGHPWEVAGAEQLEGIVVAVEFVETPVQQVVAEILGCIGFAYTEQGNHIVIEKAARALPADRCRSVSRAAARALAGVRTATSPEKNHSWQFAAISALEFIETLSSASQRPIVVPFTQTGLLRNIKLRVNVSNMPEAEVLKNLFGCIGWKYEQTGAGISAFAAETAPPHAECHGFTVL